MPKPIHVDSSQSRAIVQSIGAKLQTSLPLDPELPPSLQTYIDRLRRLEAHSGYDASA